MLGPMATSWDKVRLVPLVLVKGSEAVFADRAIDSLIAQARERDPEVEITRIDAQSYEPGTLTYLVSPSLFGEQRAIVVTGGESMSEAFLTDALSYVAAPEPDVWFVLRHSGGTRGKKLLDALTKSGETVLCEPLKRDDEKMAFVLADLHRVGRASEKEAVQALMDATSTDLRELDAAVRQLIADTQGKITLEMVNRYYGGRVEASGFKVADAAIAGDAGRAVALARHAMATGTSGVPLVAVLAVKLRTLVKVGAARGRGLKAEDLGMSAWQFKNAQKDLNGWNPEALAEAITAVAQADADVKGASRDPAYAVERVLVKVAELRNRR